MGNYFDDIQILAKEVVTYAAANGVRLATAESCTGGLVSAAITSVPGSSKVFMGAVVSYSNDVKAEVLGVCKQALKEHGAVSEVVACQMAAGAREVLFADVAVSITGVAGPGGGSEEKPVGTVWIGVSVKNDNNASLAVVEDNCTSKEHAELYNFSGDRDEVRQASVIAALQMLLDCIRK